jgi:hypothetical protein
LRLHPVRLFDHRYASGLQGSAASQQAMKRFFVIVRHCSITPDDTLKDEANIACWCWVPDTRPNDCASNLAPGDSLRHPGRKAKVFLIRIVSFQHQDTAHCTLVSQQIG